MKDEKFKFGDQVVALYGDDKRKGVVVEIDVGAQVPYCVYFGKRESSWYSEEELELYESSEPKEEFKKHKGCEFVNDDFYRAFTGKNGQIIFNKVKVSTVCICKDNFDNLVIATIDSDKRLEPNTKVKLNNDGVATVLKSIKIMNKYLDDLGQALLNSNANIIPGTLKVVGIKVVGIYKEQEVTKTELVLEEI